MSFILKEGWLVVADKNSSSISEFQISSEVFIAHKNQINTHLFSHVCL